MYIASVIAHKMYMYIASVIAHKMYMYIASVTAYKMYLYIASVIAYEMYYLGEHLSSLFLYIYSNKKETFVFHGPVSFDPAKISTQK